MSIHPNPIYGVALQTLRSLPHWTGLHGDEEEGLHAAGTGGMRAAGSSRVWTSRNKVVNFCGGRSWDGRMVGIPKANSWVGVRAQAQQPNQSVSRPWFALKMCFLS